MSVIELQGIEKIYDTGAVRVHALRNVNLSVDRGEFVAIMGTSGSGKSTLMNILGCLDRPTAGRYLLEGIDVSQLNKDQRADVRNRKLGFVFQGFNLLRRTTALENVELPLIYAGIPAAERARRSRVALSIVGLAHREDNNPSQLSGNLDTRTSLDVMGVFQRLNRESGITIVLVTHEPDIAAFASRIVTVRDGKIVSDRAVRAPRDAMDELEALPEDEEAIVEQEEV
jgi:putative ABC transport system ATP-binding protein